MTGRFLPRFSGLSKSPNRTYSIRTSDKSACSFAAQALWNNRGSSSTRIPAQEDEGPAFRTAARQAGHRLLDSSARTEVYSTTPAMGEAWRLPGRPPGVTRHAGDCVEHPVSRATPEASESAPSKLRQMGWARLAGWRECVQNRTGRSTIAATGESFEASITLGGCSDEYIHQSWFGSSSSADFVRRSAGPDAGAGWPVHTCFDASSGPRCPRGSGANHNWCPDLGPSLFPWVWVRVDYDQRRAQWRFARARPGI